MAAAVEYSPLLNDNAAPAPTPVYLDTGLIAIDYCVLYLDRQAFDTEDALKII
jgi:hypothetical protein